MQVDPRAATPPTGDGGADSREVLQAKLDWLRQVIERLPVVTYTTDREGDREQVSYVSGGIERLTGYTAAEWMADPGLWYQVIHPEDRVAATEMRRRTSERGTPYECEYRMVRRDGTELWVREKASAIQDEGRVHVDGILEDVTERRLAQVLLSAAERRTRALLEQVPAIFYEETPSIHGETSYISPQIEAILGVTQEGYRADRDWWQLHLHPDDREQVLADYEAVLVDPSMPTSTALEYRMVRPDGRVVWMMDRETVVRDELGVPTMVRGAMFDVTAQKGVEGRLQDAEARYRTLVEQLPLVTFLWEREPTPGDHLPPYYTSPQIEAILGYTQEMWNDDPNAWRDLIHPDDRDRITEAAGRSESTGEPFVEEYRYLHGTDGHTVWVHDESVMIRRHADGRPWLYQGVMYDITARVEAEERLKAAEEQYRTLVERMPAVTYVWDARATETDNRNYTSPQIGSLLGYTPEEWESSPDRWQAAIHPEDRERVLEATSRAALTGDAWSQEFRYLHRDGRTVWVHDEAAALSGDGQGRPRLFEGVMMDITDRVEADVALQVSLARFRALADGAPIGIFETDADGNCTYVNDRWCEVAGMDAAGAAGLGWADALHPEDRERVFAEWSGAVATDREFQAEYRFLHADGMVRWVTGRAAAVRGAAGTTTGFVGTVDDVTERRATEEELRLIRSAVEHTGHAVVISEFGFDAGAEPLVYANPAFGAMTGFDPDDVTGRPSSTFYEAGRAAGEIRERLRGGADHTLEVEMIRRDGSRFAAEGVVSPIRDAAGAFSHVVAILRDVTEIREVERSLRESLEELRRSDDDRRVALAQIVEAQEQDLDRMAEGIEDRSLQEMTAVRLRMETLRRNLSDPAQLGALDKLEGSVEQAVGQLRGLLSELRPRELATEGLVGAVREYLTRSAGKLSTQVVGALREEPDPSQAATAFRVVQEAVASALEARAARALRIELEDAPGGFRVRIIDDGTSWAAVRSTTMHDRAGLAGGTCAALDGPEGAAVELWLPLRAPVAGGTPLRRS